MLVSPLAGVAIWKAFHGAWPWLLGGLLVVAGVLYYGHTQREAGKAFARTAVERLEAKIQTLERTNESLAIELENKAKLLARASAERAKTKELERRVEQRLDEALAGLRGSIGADTPIPADVWRAYRRGSERLREPADEPAAPNANTPDAAANGKPLGAAPPL